jgi:hypothetical protein
MIYSMINVAPAFAEDTSPPPLPTEEPVELPPADELIDDTSVEITPTEEPVELPPADEPIDDTSVEVVSINDDLLQTQPTDTSTPPTQDQTSLSQIPEDTTIVVMVDGQIAPLASQDAANAILINDPMWCPTGKFPGDMGCTPNYPNVTTLITNLGVMSGPGTIYFTPVYSFNDVSFTYTDINLTNLGALTVQGGWNGLNNGAGYALSGVTTFNVPVTINWNDTTVTVNDITINGAAGTGLTVTSSGDIVLDNVQANGNSAYGAFLDNSAGSGDVTLTGTNTFNDNGSDGLRVLTKGAIDIVTITAGGDAATGNSGNGANLDNSAGSGDVNLSGAGNFNGNASSGLKIFSNGAISLVNITASDNVGGYGAYLSAQDTGNAVTLNGTNIFDANLLDGLYINANGDIVIFDVTANSNGASGLFLQSTANIMVNDCTDAANNGGIGVYADLPGFFFLRMGEFSGNNSGEYVVTGGGTRNIKDCVRERVVNSNKNIDKLIHKVNLISEQTVPLECVAFRGAMLMLPNGDSVYLPCPIRGKASLASLTEADLDDALPEGTAFTSGFNLQVATEAGHLSTSGEAPTSVGEMMTISFVIPESKLNADLAVLFWNGSKWAEVEGAMIENSYLKAQVDFDGLFILVGR